MNTKQFRNLFPLGSHLCREPMPAMSGMKHDMELLKKHGFNFVTLQEHRAVDEPEEGRCDCSRYHELIEHAGRLDLGVYLGRTCEQAPGWVWEKHPGCRMVDRDGKPVACQAAWTLLSDGKKKGENNRKNGNKHLAWAFVEAANFAQRYSPRAQSWFASKAVRAGRVDHNQMGD